MSGGCGPCTLCCTVIGVEFAPRPEPRKEPHEKCRHCKGGGCAIYDDRPDACRGFKCAWLFTQRHSTPLPRELRPDQTKCVIELNSAGHFIVHPKYPSVWRKEPIYSYLVSKVRGGVVIINMPDDSAHLLLLDGSTKPMQRIGTNDRNERSYLVLGATK